MIKKGRKNLKKSQKIANNKKKIKKIFLGPKMAKKRSKTGQKRKIIKKGLKNVKRSEKNS